jgi:hypothetical protein
LTFVAFRAIREAPIDKTRDIAMSYLGKLFNTLGLGSVAGAAQAAKPAASSAPVLAEAMPEASPEATVDVMAQLEKRAAANAQKLNWKTSIVDLLKLLDIDSSLGARKEMATELGCPAELMGDSAKMNMWLHKAVLRKVAANGGNVPKDLID